MVWRFISGQRITPFLTFAASCCFLVIGLWGAHPGLDFDGTDLTYLGSVSLCCFLSLVVYLPSGFPFPGPARMPAVRVSAQSRTLTIRGDRKLREYSQAVVLEDILENLKEHHVCSVQFLLGGEIRITFESSFDRDAVLCRGPLEHKGVRCRLLEGGSPPPSCTSFT